LNPTEAIISKSEFTKSQRKTSKAQITSQKSQSQSLGAKLRGAILKN